MMFCQNPKCLYHVSLNKLLMYSPQPGEPLPPKGVPSMSNMARVRDAFLNTSMHQSANPLFVYKKPQPKTWKLAGFESAYLPSDKVDGTKPITTVVQHPVEGVMVNEVRKMAFEAQHVNLHLTMTPVPIFRVRVEYDIHGLKIEGWFCGNCANAMEVVGARVFT